MANTSCCVTNPAITEVLIKESGRILSAAEAIGNDYDKATQLRMRLAEDLNAEVGTHYICPICFVRVYLHVQKTVKRFHFVHQRENGNCPALTRETLSQNEIEARKYNGAKESLAHQRMKEIIRSSLLCDPEFSEVEVETVWRGDKGAWRKPDVRAVWQGRVPVVFEIQLSTTFLHVIAQRRMFYQENGAVLVWVFKEFDLEDARMTQDDIFYNNNRNLFLASEDTLLESKAKNQLMLDCFWHDAATLGWNAGRISFEQLTLDAKRQRVFFFDHEKAALCLRLRQIVLSFSGGEDVLKWKTLLEDFRGVGIFLPPKPTELKVLFRAICSAEQGKPIGWKYRKLVEIPHHIASNYPELLLIFLAAITAYRRSAQLKAEDKEDKWQDRLVDCRRDRESGGTKYSRDTRFDAVIGYVFPEVMRVLHHWEERARSKLITQ